MKKSFESPTTELVTARHQGGTAGKGRSQRKDRLSLWADDIAEVRAVVLLHLRDRKWHGLAELFVLLGWVHPSLCLAFYTKKHGASRRPGRLRKKAEADRSLEAKVWIGRELLVHRVVNSLRHAGICRTRGRSDWQQEVRLVTVDTELSERFAKFKTDKAAVTRYIMALLVDGQWHPYRGETNLFRRVMSFLKDRHPSPSARVWSCDRYLVESALESLLETGLLQKGGDDLDEEYRLEMGPPPAPAQRLSEASEQQ